MKKTEMVKAGLSIVVSVGVGAIIGNVIKTTTPVSTSTIKKVCVGIGSIVLCNMFGEMAVKYTDSKIDDVISTVKEEIENDKLD